MPSVFSRSQTFVGAVDRRAPAPTGAPAVATVTASPADGPCRCSLAGWGSRPGIKQAFEHARRDADRRQRPAIDPAGLLLGMVEVEDALSNRLLRDAGIDPSEVRRVLLDAAG